MRKIEYVDANGILQSIDDPAQLRAAAGSLGLLGIITHITLEMDQMTFAHLKPLKQDVNLAIPPPPGYEVPSAIRKYHSPAKMERARLEFIKKAEESYYSGMFSMVIWRKSVGLIAPKNGFGSPTSGKPMSTAGIRLPIAQA